MSASPSQRLFRIAIDRVAFDLVLTATSETGIAKIVGAGRLMDPADPTETLKELGPVDVTIWGSTIHQLKMTAKTWPERFDTIGADYFGISSGHDHRFDIFLASPRFVTLIDILNGAGRGALAIHCDLSSDETLDLVRQIAFSATRGEPHA